MSKPHEVVTAITNILERAGGNPGRPGRRLSTAAACKTYEARVETDTIFRGKTSPADTTNG